MMADFHVTTRTGEKRTLEGVDGWRLMELLRDYKMGVEGICGGQTDCASCHIYVDPEWVGRLPELRDEEEAKLDELKKVKAYSEFWTNAFGDRRSYT